MSVCSENQQEDMEELKSVLKEAQMKLRNIAGLEEEDHKHMGWVALLDMVQIKSDEDKTNYKNLLEK